jgi:hypothetical protein
MNAYQKRTLVKQAEEARIAKMIEEMGEEGYKNHLAELEAKKAKEVAAAELVTLLEKAMEYSDNGVADTVDVTVTKTAAKKDWGMKQDEIDGLTPIKVGKMNKFNLSHVIAVAATKTNNNGGHINVYLNGSLERRKLYARYLHDQFQVKCRSLEDDDMVKKVYDVVRTKIVKGVDAKKVSVQKAQLALELEEERLAAFDELVQEMALGGGKKKAAIGSKSKAKAPASDATKENTENDSTKAASKKQKVTFAQGLKQRADPAQKNKE